MLTRSLSFKLSSGVMFLLFLSSMRARRVAWRWTCCKKGGRGRKNAPVARATSDGQRLGGPDTNDKELHTVIKCSALCADPWPTLPTTLQALGLLVCFRPLHLQTFTFKPRKFDA
ncbi:hypothetical protein K438DRAFT_369212 [Mycena galopus ATCC 62051]|nr:hypothetical protein K438DRAFT_369212 [Mycena galopus ATCC 62051]